MELTGNETRTDVQIGNGSKSPGVGLGKIF